MPAGALATLAPAKVNLTLRILGRRADGYHDLESLVVFAPLRRQPQAAHRSAARDFGVRPDRGRCRGRMPTISCCAPRGDRGARRRHKARPLRPDEAPAGRGRSRRRLGRCRGGAAALAQANGLALDDRRLFEAARATGADVPVCLDPRPRLMRGIGDILSAPLVLPRLGILIVHPGVAVPTAKVFAALGLAPRRAPRRRSLRADRRSRRRRSRGLACRAWHAAPTILKLPRASPSPPVIAEVLRAIAALARLPAVRACPAPARPASACLRAPAPPSPPQASSGWLTRPGGCAPGGWAPSRPPPQCVRSMENSTASSSACFIGEAGNSASASLAMAP